MNDLNKFLTDNFPSYAENKTILREVEQGHYELVGQFSLGVLEKIHQSTVLYEFLEGVHKL